MRLVAATGAREAEIVALAWDDLEGDQLRIQRQRHGIDGEVVIRDKTKTGSSRTVTLDSATVARIEAWHAEADELVGAPTSWMVAEPGAPVPPSPRWLYDVFVRAGKRAGVPTGRKAGYVLHDIRHWAGSTALRDGHDPVTVAARLGSSPETCSASTPRRLSRDKPESPPHWPPAWMADGCRTSCCRSRTSCGGARCSIVTAASSCAARR